MSSSEQPKVTSKMRNHQNLDLKKRIHFKTWPGFCINNILPFGDVNLDIALKLRTFLLFFSDSRFPTHDSRFPTHDSWLKIYWVSIKDGGFVYIVIYPELSAIHRHENFRKCSFWLQLAAEKIWSRSEDQKDEKSRLSDGAEIWAYGEICSRRCL